MARGVGSLRQLLQPTVLLPRHIDTGCDAPGLLMTNKWSQYAYRRRITEIAMDACFLYAAVGGSNDEWSSKNDRERKRQLGHCQGYYCPRPGYDSQEELAYLRKGRAMRWLELLVYVAWEGDDGRRQYPGTIPPKLEKSVRNLPWHRHRKSILGMDLGPTLYNTSEGREAVPSHLHLQIQNWVLYL